MKTSFEIVKIPFYGDCIEAYIDEQLKAWVNLRRMCESLGVDYSTQLAKLRSPNYDWSSMGMIPTLDSNGHRQKTCFIDLDSLVGWLVTIQPSKVAFDVRDKLRTFKKESFRTLSGHFFGDIRAKMLAASDQERTLAEAGKLALACKQEAGQAFAIASTALKKADAVEKMLEAVLNPFRPSPVEPMTIRRARDEWNIMGSDGRPLPDRALPGIGNTLTAMCKAARQPVTKEDDGIHGLVNSYPPGVIATWKANHDFRSRVTTESYSKFTQPRLFG